EDRERIRREVIAEIEQRRGADFDRVHSVQRAADVGAVDEVIQPNQLREAIIRHQQQAFNDYNLGREAAALERTRAGVDPVLRLPEGQGLDAFLQGLIRVHGEDGAREEARRWSQGLLNFAGNNGSTGGNSGESNSGTNGSGEGPASPP
ncbi:MAG TPA: hypothetical protein VJP40_09150, partial [bacterium]|nr:hypothetical protein [bacterium]